MRPARPFSNGWCHPVLAPRSGNRYATVERPPLPDRTSQVADFGDRSHRAMTGCSRQRVGPSVWHSSPTFTALTECGMISAEVAIRREGKRTFGSVHAAAAWRRQPELLEDGLNVRRLQNGRDDLQLVTAVRALFHVDLELALELPRPAGARRPAMRVLRLVWLRNRPCSASAFLPRRSHRRAQLGAGCQHVVEADQVQSGPWHPCCQPLHELQRRLHQVRRAVAPRRRELQTPGRRR